MSDFGIDFGKKCFGILLPFVGKNEVKYTILWTFNDVLFYVSILLPFGRACYVCPYQETVVFMFLPQSPAFVPPNLQQRFHSWVSSFYTSFETAALYSCPTLLLQKLHSKRYRIAVRLSNVQSMQGRWRVPATASRSCMPGSLIWRTFVFEGERDALKRCRLVKAGQEG